MEGKADLVKMNALQKQHAPPYGKYEALAPMIHGHKTHAQVGQLIRIGDSRDTLRPSDASWQFRYFRMSRPTVSKHHTGTRTSNVWKEGTGGAVPSLAFERLQHVD